MVAAVIQPLSQPVGQLPPPDLVGVRESNPHKTDSPNLFSYSIQLHGRNHRISADDVPITKHHLRRIVVRKGVAATVASNQLKRKSAKTVAIIGVRDCVRLFPSRFRAAFTARTRRPAALLFTPGGPSPTGVARPHVGACVPTCGRAGDLHTRAQSCATHAKIPHCDTPNEWRNSNGFLS